MRHFTSAARRALVVFRRAAMGIVLLILGLSLLNVLPTRSASAGVIVTLDESGGSLSAAVDSSPEDKLQGVGADPIIWQVIQEAIGVPGRIDITFQFFSTGTIPGVELETIYNIYDVLPPEKDPKDPGDKEPKDPGDPQPKVPKGGILSDWLAIKLTSLDVPPGNPDSLPNFQADIAFLSADSGRTLSLPPIPKDALVVDLLETNGWTTVDSGLADLVVSFRSDDEAAAVPEPASVIMFLIGMSAALVWRRRKILA